MQAIYTFLPGMHGSAELFAPLLQALGDVPTECIEYPTAIPQNYQALEHWMLQHIDWSIPRVLVAESFSGPLALKIALKIAHKFPQSVQSLVLAASFCSAPRNSTFSLLPLRPLLMLRPTRNMLRHYLLGESATDAQVDALSRILSKIPLKVLSQRIHTILNLEITDCPTLKHTPMLILQASEDNLISWETQNLLRMRYENATTHWIDAPHMLLQHSATTCAQLIKTFAEEHAPQFNHV